ncbi:hypothetical protein [Sinomicrobium sp. M5D2P17]
MKINKWKIPANIRGGKASQFVFFFFVSFLLWFLIKLPNRYTSTVSLKPDYSGVPENKLLVNPPRTIKVYINAKGMQLLGMKYFGREVNIDLSGLRKNEDGSFLLAGDLKKQLTGVLPEDVEVRQFAADTLFFSLGENIIRKVKVMPRADITFAKDYRIYDSLTVSPSKINVFGPDVEVNNLDTLYTSKITLRDVNEDIHMNIAVDIPQKYKNLEFKDKKVAVKARVERFSEGRFTVPVFVINVPEEKSVKTFPSEIEIICEGALRDISKLQSSDFKVTCDFKAITDSVNYLPLRVSKMPETIKRVELSRHGVEILVKNSDQKIM